MRKNKSRIIIHDSEELDKFLKEYPNIVFSTIKREDHEGAVYFTEFNDYFYVTETGVVQKLLGYRNNPGLWEHNRKMTKNIQHYLDEIKRLRHQSNPSLRGTTISISRNI